MEMNEIINHIGLKIGEITEIDPDNRTRVLLKDLETKEETPWCNFLFSYAGNGKGIFLDHAIGDKVLFTLFSDEQGFIFGQYYAKGDTVPGSENNDVLHQINSSNFLGVDKVSKTLKCNYDNIEAKGATKLLLDSDISILLGENGVDFLIKGTAFVSLFNTLVGVISSHSHGLAADPALVTACTNFVAGVNNTLSTLAKVE